jgi:hypothetical protein
MTNLWIDPLSDDGQELIDNRINELINTDFKPANLVNEAVSEFTVKENQQVADYVNENDMAGLGNYIYLKTYDFAYLLATKQAEHEFNNGELNNE